MDMTASIVPRSDQVNADDLISGPVTVTVDRVTEGSSEQPVDVHLVEFPERAFRPSKSMRRVMVAAWGPDTSAYTGHRMTLYRDPLIRFGKDEVGGIRISHMSHIDRALRIALTVTRGKREPFTVTPLPDAAPVIPPATREQQVTLAELLTAAGIEDKLAYVSEQVGRPISSARDLDRAEASAVIDALDAMTVVVEEPPFDMGEGA